MAERRYETNQDVAELLRDAAAAYQIKGMNRFQATAYETAATGVEHANQNVRDLSAEHHLQQIPGVGPAIAGYLEELINTGHVAHFEEVFQGIPEAVFELVKIPGVG